MAALCIQQCLECERVMKGGLSIVLGLGKPKGKPMPGDDDAPESSPDMGKGEDDYTSVLFDALKDDDKEAFAAAFKGAVKACMGEGDDEEHEMEA